MQVYRAKGTEYMREGFTHLFKVLTADLTGFSNVQVTLTTLAAGDTVIEAVLDVKTVVTGPTGSPTGQVKINTANIAITPTAVLNSATTAGSVTNNSIAGGGMLQTGTDTLVLDLQAGGGNGAVATAGEVWCWCRISRQADRVQLQA